MPDEEYEGGGPRVLLVDGDVKALEVVDLELGKRGYEVRTATSVGQAGDELNSDTFDIIVAETLVPKEGGFAFLREVRASPTTASIPFIFLTADRTVANRVAGLDLGVDDYITKPCVFDEFSARLAATIRRREAAEAHAPSPGERTGGFELAGNLSVVKVDEVLRMLTTNLRTGLLRVHTEFGQGEIYLQEIRDGPNRKGAVRHAILPGIAGGSDVIVLLSDMAQEKLEGATFDFQAGVQPPIVTVGHSAQDLLLNAAKEADHLARVKKDYADGKK